MKNSTTSTRVINSLTRPLAAIALAAALVCGNGPMSAIAADTVSEKVGAVAADAEKKVEETSRAAGTRMEELWQRIDEQRLKHRTPDQIVSWVIVGLLVGGVIQQFSRWNKFTNLTLGLVGAFLGGILASLAQVDFGLGPVLIRYEELIASLAGGLVILFGARFIAARKAAKAKV